MLKRSVALVARGTLPGVPVAEVHGVLEPAIFGNEPLAGERLIECGVADRAIVAYDLTFLAYVLPVMAAETSLRIEMADVVDVA
jgi:hypothetical protein